MHPHVPNANSPLRRKLLGCLVSATALMGLHSAADAVSVTGGTGSPDPSEMEAPAELFAMARLRSYKARCSSSWDRMGANADTVPIESGKTAMVFYVSGSGVVTHIWLTIASKDPYDLKNLVLRGWWDGESTPSVETPIGDFFGLGLSEYSTYQSALLAVAPIKALNAYFKMPYLRSARITGVHTTDLTGTTEDHCGKIRLHQHDLFSGKDATAPFPPGEKDAWSRFSIEPTRHRFLNWPVNRPSHVSTILADRNVPRRFSADPESLATWAFHRT